VEETLLLIGLSLVLLLIFREFVCWYWKINSAISHLESIDKSLKLLVKQSSGTATAAYEALPVQGPEEVLTEKELMERYYITFENEKYHHESYSYDRLQDAVNYAKQLKKK
jgi:hypothetical protein